MSALPLLMLPDSRRTTRLGFGCAYLTPENRRVLDVAYEAGIRHFDVGRSYGRGFTEGMLGRFLRGKTDVTVTSKYGIVPPFSHPLHAALRVVLRPLARRLRRSAAMSARIEQSSALTLNKAQFTGAEARASLALSLRNLKLQRLDLFLMHEPEPCDLADESLLAALQSARTQGDIGAFGVGGKSQHLAQLQVQRPGYCGVLQYDWTPLEPVPSHPESFSILYRVYREPARRLHEAFASDPSLARRFSDEIDSDLGASGRVEQLLLNATLALRAGSLVLFSSTRPEHVRDNVRNATDARLTAAALRLVDLLRRRDAALAA
jgi:aryl-alcohol dehydrogenase-like predicted oxidoreductase